jgi:hypothetical protein
MDSRRIYQLTPNDRRLLSLYDDKMIISVQRRLLMTALILANNILT